MPLINQFFNSSFLYNTPEAVADAHRDLLDYIKDSWDITDKFGHGRWNELNLEDVFTSLAIENEFAPTHTDNAARSQLRLNDLKRYIAHVIGHISTHKFGRYTRLLSRGLKKDDTLISFNYDLLMDQELLDYQSRCSHYRNFKSIILEEPVVGDALARLVDTGSGLYLKLHGSLNWFVCTNDACPYSSRLKIFSYSEQSLAASLYETEFQCDYCKGSLTPYLIPPLLNKPIVRDRLFRIIWSNAKYKLEQASNVVIIGYSFPPTDFYAHWLFRSALKDMSKKVYVVNPLNEDDSFEKRVSTILTTTWGYDKRFLRFDQIEDILSMLDTEA